MLRFSNHDYWAHIIELGMLDWDIVRDNVECGINEDLFNAVTAGDITQEEADDLFTGLVEENMTVHVGWGTSSGDVHYKSLWWELVNHNAPLEYLEWAGRDWPDETYNSGILDAILEESEEKHTGIELVNVGTYWRDSRWDEKVIDTLLKVGDEEDIENALIGWTPERRNLLMSRTWLGVDNA